MATNQLFIPDRIRVGFNRRGDTYTGKLAYVIYYDKSGKLRKEKSWKTWCDHKIPAQEFKNEPTEGFVLNKGVGGARQSWGWNARNEYIRVYDPRDFEFEISVANLLFILRECDCSRGKGLEGKFVYSWDGTELVLLPAGSQEYKQSSEFTDLKDKKIYIRDLVVGTTHKTKNQELHTYLGKLDFYFVVNKERYYDYKAKRDEPGVAQRHIFWDGEKFRCYQNVKHLAIVESTTPPPNFAELIDDYHKQPFGSKPVGLMLKEHELTKEEQERIDMYGPGSLWGEWWFEEPSGNSFASGNTNYDFRAKKVNSVQIRNRVSLEDDGRIVKNGCEFYSCRDGETHPRHWGGNPVRYPVWVEPTNMDLYVELESGETVPFKSMEMNGARNG